MFHFNVLVVSWKGKTVIRKALHPLNDCRHWVDRAGPYRSKKKSYLNMIQKRRRFLWAKAHLKWTVAKWKTVLWSDESKFEVLFGKLGRHVIRTKEDKDNPSCYQRSVQKPASLMVWGYMSVCGMGSLHIWKGTINADISKVYPSSRTTYAPIQTSSLSVKTLHFPTWQCQTTYCINYNIMAA